MLLIALIVIVIISMGQNAEQNRRMEIYHQAYGYSRNGKPADVQMLEMRERVRKEWMSLGNLNCLGKFPSEYPGGPYQNSRRRNWFRAHLEAKGIPYDDLILDEVSGIAGERFRRNITEYERYHRRGWF